MLRAAPPTEVSWNGAARGPPCVALVYPAEHFPYTARATANPLGVKGAGEAGAVGAPPAVINAIVDALQRRVGLRHIDMPATPRRVWEMLNGIH